MMTAEQIAQHELQDEVELEVSEEFGSCVLTRWKTTISLPMIRIAICDNGRENYAVSKDLETFQRFLEDARPELDNAEKVAKLLQIGLPMHLRPLPAKNSDYINRKTGHRNPPHFDGSALVFYCNDFQIGRVVRVTIQSDHKLFSEYVGEGVEMDLL